MIWAIVILFLICIVELILLHNLWDQLNMLKNLTYNKFVYLDDTLISIRKRSLDYSTLVADMKQDINKIKFEDKTELIKDIIKSIEKLEVWVWEIDSKLTKPKKKVTKKAKK